MILILNASGNIGSELVKELIKRGADFTAAYRSPEQVAKAQQSGQKAVVADFAKPETLVAAFEGVKKAFFVTPPGLQLEELESSVVAAAKNADVRHLVKLSVWGAEEAAISFAIPHHNVEKKIIAANIPYTFLRPTGFMQNMLSNAATIKSQSAFYIPAGDARVAEIDVRDIARVAAVVLTEEGHIGKAYDLSGGEASTMQERAQIISDVLGRTISYFSPSAADWKKTMLGYGLPEWQVDGIIELLGYYNGGNSQRVSPAVEDITGSKPITYRQFVEDNVEAFR